MVVALRSEGRPDCRAGSKRCPGKGGSKMSRNFILAMGALLWTIVAIAVVGHVMVGETISPALALIGGVVWVAVRRAQRVLTGARAQARVEAR
jgi:hypothetical protein